ATRRRRVPSGWGSSVNSTRVVWTVSGLGCQRNAKRCGGSTASITPRVAPRGPVEPSHVKTTSPPGRRSMVACVPNQAPSWSGRVSAVQTRAGGTGKTSSRSIESGTSTATSRHEPATRWLHARGEHNYTATMLQPIGCNSTERRGTFGVRSWNVRRTCVVAHKVVSHEEWVAVPKKHLAKHKEFTRLRD